MEFFRSLLDQRESRKRFHLREDIINPASPALYLSDSAAIADPQLCSSSLVVREASAGA